MGKYIDPIRFVTFIILLIQLIPICYVTWRTGMEVVNISTADPATYFSTRWKISPPEEGKILTIFMFEIFSWLIFLSVLTYYVVPQVLALYGLLKKKPSYMKLYIHVRVVEFLFWIILSMLMAVTFLNVGFNRAYVEEALLKFGSSGNATEVASYSSVKLLEFRHLEEFLFSLMVLSIMITYGLHILKSVVYSCYRRLEAEEIFQKEKMTTNYHRLEGEEEV